MNIDEFKALMKGRDTRRPSITAGGLLQENASEADLRGAVLHLKGILAANPQLFRSEGEFFEWMHKPENAAQVVKRYLSAASLPEGDSARIGNLHQEALKRWDDPLWDRQTGRHEYRHTVSACDDKEPLLEDFCERFSSLEHLQLWSLGSLKKLPPLPGKLRTLDLRNAGAILSLPELPESLETLDLSGCRSLREWPSSRLPKLKRLYLGGCVALSQKGFETFLQGLDCVSVLEEIEVHDNAWLERIPLPPSCSRLNVVRASECPKLNGLPPWEQWSALDHLDLRNCPNIDHLPQLPAANLRYLGLHGCDRLRQYLGQDLNERDLGTHRAANAADNFRLRTRLGSRTCERPRCKLLFLGNGRGGKTTLSKALQWREMDDGSRRKHPELKPKHGEDISHSIQQWKWKTELPGAGEALIRIWDFGGQETYHGTHRIFAASGALYVIVLREGGHEPHDPKGIIPDGDWAHYNRQRRLEYWLDYVLDLDRTHGARAAARARVLLVHMAHVGEVARVPMVPGLDARYREFIAGEWWVGALENEWTASDFETTFRTALKQELDRQVREEGIRIPLLFQEVMDEIAARTDDGKVKSVADANAILSWDDWKALIDGCASRCGAPALDDRDAQAIARVLHQSGEIFWMHTHDWSVILQQRAALEEIYRLLDFRKTELSAFRKDVKDKYGLFDGRRLREDWWSGFPEELQSQLIDFMTMCQICVPVLRPGDDGVVGEPLLALDPTLLPEHATIAGELAGDFNAADIPIHREEPWRLLKREKRDRPFSESGFRALQAWAARQIGNGVRLWWNGLQYTSPDRRVGFRARWQGDGSADAYGGALLLEYWEPAGGPETPESSAALKQWLFGPGSPFPLEDWGIAPVASDWAVPGRRDIGISVRGAQQSRAAELEKQIEKEPRESGRSLDVFLYVSENESTMSATYDAIRKARRQILWVSDEYLEADAANSVTLHELANAVFTWAKQQGVAVDPVHLKDLPVDADQQVFVVYENGPSFTFREGFYDRTHAALTAMERYLAGRIASLAGEGKDTVTESKHKAKFAAAAGLSKAFCQFYLDQLSGRSPYVGKAHTTVDELEALARRISSGLR